MYRRRRRRWLRSAGFVLVVLTALFYVMERTLRPTMEAVIRHTVQIRATEAINRAIQGIAGAVRYEDLYLIRQNQEGMITFLQPNTPEINRLVTQVALAVQQELRRMQSQTFTITLAQVLGTRLFATRGPGLTVSVQSIGTVTVDVQSRFEQAGLNQTRHVVFLRVHADVQAVAPTFQQVFPVEEQVPLVEGIIVGPVPTQGILNLQPAPSGP